MADVADKEVFLPPPGGVDSEEPPRGKGTYVGCFHDSRSTWGGGNGASARREGGKVSMLKGKRQGQGQGVKCLPPAGISRYRRTEQGPEGSCGPEGRGGKEKGKSARLPEDI